MRGRLEARLSAERKSMAPESASEQRPQRRDLRQASAQASQGTRERLEAAEAVGGEEEHGRGVRLAVGRNEEGGEPGGAPHTGNAPREWGGNASVKPGATKSWRQAIRHDCKRSERGPPLATGGHLVW